MEYPSKKEYELSSFKNMPAGRFRGRASAMKSLFCVVPAALVLAGCGLESSKEVPVMVSSSCSIDRPAPGFQAAVGKAFNVTGWAFEKSARQAPVKTQVQFSSPDMEEIKVVDASQALARPDVAQALNAPGAATSGYDALVAADRLPANTYAVTIIQRYPAYSVACPYARTITVK